MSSEVASILKAFAFVTKLFAILIKAQILKSLTYTPSSTKLARHMNISWAKKKEEGLFIN
jgi:hypothetical protein